MKRTSTYDDIAIIKERDAKISEVKTQYNQIVKDFELYYSDQSQELCTTLIVHTRQKINEIIENSNLLLKGECIVHKRLCLGNR